MTDRVFTLFQLYYRAEVTIIVSLLVTSTSAQRATAWTYIAIHAQLDKLVIAKVDVQFAYCRGHLHRQLVVLRPQRQEVALLVVVDFVGNHALEDWRESVHDMAQ